MIQFKEIHYDSVVTEFGLNGKALHIHFRAGKRLKDLKEIDVVLDKALKAYFHLEIRPTGEFIQEQLKSLDLDQQYSPKENEAVTFPKGRSLFYKRDLPKSRPEEFKKVQELYKELMQLYSDESVIHKTFTEDLNLAQWGELESWGYIIHYTFPGLDEIMLKLCQEINQDLIDQGFVS